MAANREQAVYLGSGLIGMTTVTAGLVARADHSLSGTVVALAGVALLGYSALGFYRVKRAEIMKQS